MKISNILSELVSQTRTAKVVVDLRSRYLEISDWTGGVVWVGDYRDLEENELEYEVIPSIQEKE